MRSLHIDLTNKKTQSLSTRPQCLGHRIWIVSLRIHIVRLNNKVVVATPAKHVDKTTQLTFQPIATPILPKPLPKTTAWLPFRSRAGTAQKVVAWTAKKRAVQDESEETNEQSEA